MTSIAGKVIKPKLGLLVLAKQLGNVSKACDVMGYSWDSFYRFGRLVGFFNDHLYLTSSLGKGIRLKN